MADKLEVKSDHDMVNGTDMRISNISLIIYCAYRYIFMVLGTWEDEALPILVDASTHSRPLEHTITNFFQELMQSFVYLMPMTARSGEGGRR